jgi:hypothetical protein
MRDFIGFSLPGTAKSACKPAQRTDVQERGQGDTAMSSHLSQLIRPSKEPDSVAVPLGKSMI